MNYIYQVVADDVKFFETEQALIQKHEIIGFNRNIKQRKELQGQPKLAGLLGPMYNGLKDGKTCIRYESQKVYNSLSI